VAAFVSLTTCRSATQIAVPVVTDVSQVRPAGTAFVVV
jgi:hypothetical protein